MNKNNKNIVSIEDRIPKLKEARKKKANRRLVFYMTIFFFLISIIIYLQSPLSEVKQVTVQNNAFVPDEEIVEISGLSEKQNIWAIDFAAVEETLENNPIIDTVTVDRKLPSTVAITVQEKEIIGILETEEGTYLPVLESGELLEMVEYQSFTGEAPLLIGFTDQEYLAKAANELNKLPKDILDLISEMYWQPTEDNKNNVLFYMNDGFIVQSSIRDFADGMTIYPSVVSQLDPEVKGVIHMGVGVYFEAFDAEDEEVNADDEELMGESETGESEE
ncbi:cell division protein FtsQ/DivIB [Oceanobacillus alkalisoli]|uniref:cell division protein FtsQ/DivIB n=1 Tax=Oceanobacillus alkalisoli TaxID=2925113 RepID=UPI001F11EF33|nr:FtsQ-type POTRA domain-containing protein [Oceanobacillus alkalisoli]MCF3942516.1 FtsQ-type POTRA domain-containing protein [Oceanobacillus alkalisoli]